jgi:hypothetical protein
MTNFSTMSIGGRDGPFVLFSFQLVAVDGRWQSMLVVSLIGSMLHIKVRSGAASILLDSM